MADMENTTGQRPGTKQRRAKRNKWQRTKVIHTRRG